MKNANIELDAWELEEAMRGAARCESDEISWMEEQQSEWVADEAIWGEARSPRKLTSWMRPRKMRVAEPDDDGYRR